MCHAWFRLFQSCGSRFLWSTPKTPWWTRRWPICICGSGDQIECSFSAQFMWEYLNCWGLALGIKSHGHPRRALFTESATSTETNALQEWMNQTTHRPPPTTTLVPAACWLVSGLVQNAKNLTVRLPSAGTLSRSWASLSSSQWLVEIVSVPLPSRFDSHQQFSKEQGWQNRRKEL